MTSNQKLLIGLGVAIGTIYLLNKNKSEKCLTAKEEKLNFLGGNPKKATNSVRIAKVGGGDKCGVYAQERKVRCESVEGYSWADYPICRCTFSRYVRVN
jgi:hypothetical protein